MTKDGLEGWKQLAKQYGALLVECMRSVDDPDLARRIREAVYGEEVEDGNKLMPMSTAPKDATWILAWTNDRYGNKRWQCVHWAQGGGEEQPPFRGWFYFCGDGHAEIDAERLLGWVSLPEAPKK